MYIIVKTQINILFAISMVSCFAKNRKRDYFSIINQILRYIASSPKKDITFKEESELNFIRYSDSNSTRDHFDKKFISRFVFTLNKRFISFSLKKQVVLAL